MKKTYYPRKTFDDHLDAFAKLCKEKGWSFSGVDMEQLFKDAEEQRKERAEHDALELKFRSVHERFGVHQNERYMRFAAALNAARGAFRNDKETMAELNKFKRSVRRRSSTS